MPAHGRIMTLGLLLLATALCHQRCWGEEPTSTKVSPFLTNMPRNSNKRCVGIAGVAEALLDGEQVAHLKMSPAELSREVYQNFTTDKIVRYPSHLNLAGKRGSIEIKAIDNKAVLETLSTRVANLYKADYQRLAHSQTGINRLIAAQNNVVRTSNELVELLNADPDKTGVFCCFGKRIFPDGKVSDTSHAVLIELMPHDVFLIYDPNDPGISIECELKELPQGLMLTWQCKYRDKNVTTTQQYTVVPQARFFRALQ